MPFLSITLGNPYLPVCFLIVLAFFFEQRVTNPMSVASVARPEQYCFRRGVAVGNEVEYDPTLRD
jgi:hypothetical protein